MNNNQDLSSGDSWDHYFRITKNYKEKEFDSFLSILRYTMYRPRDFITLFLFIQKRYPNKDSIDNSIFNDNENIIDEYLKWLMGELKDQFSFYYPSKNFNILLDFIKDFCRGNSNFNYRVFSEFYDYKIKDMESESIPAFLKNKKDLLQLLYSFNLVGFRKKEGEQWIDKWCMKQRDYINPSPEIDINSFFYWHIGFHRYCKNNK